jgi:hypothetical protein
MRKPSALSMYAHTQRGFRDGDAAEVEELALTAFDQSL